ncbi:MAG: cytochrome c [Cyclobacteriaceae bacterium]|nr:cytochrome c [Cyclobacteriaceae bacterium]
MKHILTILSALLIASCSSSPSGNESAAPPGKVETPATLEEIEKSFEKYKGVGPVSEVEVGDEIDQTLADEGKVIFEAKCTACHKTDKRFIGPGLKGITERRTPEWTMNMILNPEKMTQEDPIGKLLLIEYNGSPMANQNLTEEEARKVFEYFRTL